MSKESISIFFRLNSKLFNKNYADAIKLVSADSIHDLRVSYKRLNALVNLLNFDNSANFRIRNNFKHLKLVFKAAASLRDFQVLEDLIVHYQQYKDLQLGKIGAYIKKLKEDSLKEFLSNAKDFNSLAISRLFGIIENHLKNLDELQVEEQFNSFKNNHLLLLSKYSDPLSDKYNLHSARKIIKDLGYLIEMSEPAKADNNAQLPLYKEAGRYLGDWHDRLVLQNFLQQKSNLHSFKNISYKELIQLIGNEKESFENQYFTILKSFRSC